MGFTTLNVYNRSPIENYSHYLVFVDLSAAFDHLPRQWMFDSIKLRFKDDQSSLLIDILEKLYENTSLTFEEATFVKEDQKAQTCSIYTLTL